MGQNISGHGGCHPGGLLRHHTGPHPGVGPPAAGPEAPAAPCGGGGQPLLRLAGEPGHGPGLRRRRGGADQPHRPAEAEGGPVRQELGLRRGAGPPGAAGGGGLPGGQRRAPGHRRGGGPAQSGPGHPAGVAPAPGHRLLRPRRPRAGSPGLPGQAHPELRQWGSGEHGRHAAPGRQVRHGAGGPGPGRRRHLRQPSLPPGHRSPGGPGGPGGGGVAKRYLHRLPGYGRLCQPGRGPGHPGGHPPGPAGGVPDHPGGVQRQPRPAGPGRAQPRLPGGLSGGGAQRAHRQHRLPGDHGDPSCLPGPHRGGQGLRRLHRRPPDRRHRRQAGGAGSGFGGGDAGGLYHQRPEGDGPRRRGGPPGGPRAFGGHQRLHHPRPGPGGGGV